MYHYPRLDNNTAPPYLPLTDPALRVSLTELDKATTLAIGATFWGQPVGIALANYDSSTQQAQLEELFVTPECRRAGIGTTLLATLEAALAEQGGQKIEVLYQTDEYTPYMERLLQKQGWHEPELKTYLFWGIMQRGGTPWVDESRLPEGFEPFPWAELTAAERQAIEARQAAEPWYTSEFSPFNVPPAELSPNSIGLRYEGQVVGWVIIRPAAEEYLLYDILFVAPEFQSTGLGLHLLANAIQRHQAQHPRHESAGLWRVKVENRRMLGLVNQWLKGSLTHQAEERFSSKTL